MPSLDQRPANSTGWVERSEHLWHDAVKEAYRLEEGSRDSDYLKKDRLEVLNSVHHNAEVQAQQFGDSESRQAFAKIAAGALKFQAIGDAAASLAPMYAGVPWAVCKSILMVATNKYEAHQIMLNQLQKVTDILCLNREFEEVYFRQAGAPGYDAGKAVEVALTKLYTAVLRFLLKAQKYFTRQKGFIGKVKRATRSGLGLDSETSDLIMEISYQQEKVRHRAPMMQQSSQNQMFVMARNTTESLSEMQTSFQNIQARDEQEQTREVLNWLSPINVHAEHSKQSEGLLINTGMWLFNSPKFKDWMKSGANVLWLHGDTGFGKTRLVTAVISRLRQSTETDLAYFYCNGKSGGDQAKPSALRIFQTLVRQLSATGGDHQIDKDALNLFEEAESENPDGMRDIALGEALSLLRTFSSNKQVSLVLDALDECAPKDRRKVLDELFGLSGNYNVKVFLSSRSTEYSSMRRGRAATEVALDATINEADLIRFIDRGVLEDEKFSFDADVCLLERVANTLKKDANGSGSDCDNDDVNLDLNRYTDHIRFQYAELQIENLYEAVDPSSLETRLKKRPRKLTNIYDSYVDRINQQQGFEEYDKATSVIRWLKCAQVPLSKLTLVGAISVPEDGNESEGRDEPSSEQIKDNLIKVCCGVVSFNQDPSAEGDDSGSFSFMHQSCGDYFEEENPWHDSSDSLNEFAAKRCLKALQTELPEGSGWRRTASQKFREYAVRFLLEHLSLVSRRSAALQRDIDLFLDPGTYNHSGLQHWLTEARSSHGSGPSPLQSVLSALEFAESVIPMAACIFGSPSIIERYKHNFDPDKSGKTGETALCLAIENSQKETVTKLFKVMPNINVNKVMERASSQLQKFQYSEMLEYTRAHQRLFDPYRVDVWQANEQWTKLSRVFGQVVPAFDRIFPATAMQAAIMAGDRDLIALLVEKGADLSLAAGCFGDTLQTAVIREHVRGQDSWQQDSIFEFLLEKGASANDPGGYFGTALMAAARFGQRVIFTQLLRIGAEPSITCASGCNILHNAVLSCNVELVDYIAGRYPELLEAPSLMGTPLQLAAGGSSIGVLRILLDRKANPNGKSDVYQSALVPAAGVGNKDIAILLIQKGANLDKVTAECRGTLLRQAAFHAIIELLELVLKADSRLVDDTDRDRRTPLHYAARNGRPRAARILVQKGADVLMRNSRGRSAFEYASENDHPVVLSALAEGYTAIHGKDKLVSLLSNGSGRWESPLHRAAKKGSPRSVQKLLELGAIPKAGNSNVTPLHHASWFGRQKCVEALLSVEREKLLEFLDHRNWIGKTALLDAAEKGNVEIGQMLLEAGANVNIKAKDGPWNIFHYLAWRSDTTFMELVLDFLSERPERGSTKELLNQPGRGRTEARTPFQYAIGRNSQENVRRMLAHGADIDQAHKDSGAHAVLVAIRTDRFKVFPVLLDHAKQHFTAEKFAQFLRVGEPESGRDNDSRFFSKGDTFLHHAAWKSPEMTKLLLEYDADLTQMKNAAGWYPLHSAALRGATEAAELLARAWPAGLKARNDAGASPADVVREVALVTGKQQKKKTVDLLERLEKELNC